MANGEKFQIQCATCDRKTNHEVVHEVSTHDSNEDNDIHVGESFEIVRCLGCETIGFRHTSWCSEDLDPQTGEVDVRETLYPSQSAGRISIPGWVHLPAKVASVYDETLRTFNAGARLLSAAGLRALVEAVCLDQKCAGRDLKTKIDALVTTGALAAKQAEFLHIHRFLGNEAVHEITAPPAEELTAALDILESVLRTIYELPVVAADLKARRDARLARAKKASGPSGGS